MSRETFYLKVEVETDGADSDTIYNRLTNKLLFGLDEVVDVTELPDPEFSGKDSEDA